MTLSKAFSSLGAFNPPLPGPSRNLAKIVIHTEVLMISQGTLHNAAYFFKGTRFLTNAGILWFWKLQRTVFFGFSDHTSGAKSNSSLETGTHEEKTLLAPACKAVF